MIDASRVSLFRLLAPVLAICIVQAAVHAEMPVQWWSSTEDLKHTLTTCAELPFSSGGPDGKPCVLVDGTATYQNILGLGSSLEHSTCYNLSLLPIDRRERAMESIVHTTKGIGMSLMRICIGTPDFTASPWYTYDDMPPGQKDPELKHFSIAKDREYVLPILKLAVKLNPQIQFVASPWSPPGWMKTNDRICGGKINPEHFAPFAEYLARFVEAYREEGINVHALTVQNEPEFNPGSYPTCGWTAAQQRDFIRDHLGPALRKHGLRTLVWCFDHNFNHPEFPATILRDPQAAQYVDGSAFHLYEGKPASMSKLHEEFPEKHIYFTEGSTYDASGAVEIISYFRNWARSYNAWVTVIDHKMKPNPGPHDCSPTCILLDSNTLKLDYRFDYYLYGHFTKFIRPGAVRIGSTAPSKQPSNVVFRNPDGSIVMIAANPKTQPQELSVDWKGHSFTATLDPKSVATFRWMP
jgi:glucosylceramidase